MPTVSLLSFMACDSCGDSPRRWWSMSCCVLSLLLRLPLLLLLRRRRRRRRRLTVAHVSAQRPTAALHAAGIDRPDSNASAASRLVAVQRVWSIGHRTQLSSSRRWLRQIGRRRSEYRPPRTVGDTFDSLAAACGHRCACGYGTWSAIAQRYDVDVCGLY